MTKLTFMEKEHSEREINRNNGTSISESLVYNYEQGKSSNNNCSNEIDDEFVWKNKLNAFFESMNRENIDRFG